MQARLSSRQSCNLFQGISHPNIHRYGTLVVGCLCLDYSLGVVEFFYQIYLSLFYFNLAYCLVVDSYKGLLSVNRVVIFYPDCNLAQDLQV